MPKLIEIYLSFPTRERGLKYAYYRDGQGDEAVVPHAGTWIEIIFGDFVKDAGLGRSPRGNVD